MPLIINDDKKENIESFLGDIGSLDNVENLKKLLEKNSIYFKTDKPEDVKLFMNNIWGNLYIYSTKVTPIKKIELDSETASMNSEGSGRYDITHKGGYRYSIFM